MASWQRAQAGRSWSSWQWKTRKSVSGCLTRQFSGCNLILLSKLKEQKMLSLPFWVTVFHSLEQPAVWILNMTITKNKFYFWPQASRRKSQNSPQHWDGPWRSNFTPRKCFVGECMLYWKQQQASHMEKGLQPDHLHNEHNNPDQAAAHKTFLLFSIHLILKSTLK